MNVLVITTRGEAMNAGANLSTGHHRSSPEIQFWWPTRPREVLIGRHFDLVIKDTTLHMTGEQVAWFRAYCCRSRETVFVEANEIGGSVLLETT